MKDKLFIFGLTLESVNVFGPFQKVGGKEGGYMKGNLYQNFAVAEWLVYWTYLPEITEVIGKHKIKYLVFGAIWSITWSWKGDFLVFS